MKNAFILFLLGVFLSFTGLEPAFFIARQFSEKKISADKFDYTSESKDSEKEDGKESEKEGEKEFGKEKEYAAQVYFFSGCNTAFFHQMERFIRSGQLTCSSGFSGEIFSPPEIA